MQKHFDAIVIGFGGIGSAALCELASRGLNVLGIDRYPPGHDQGSSHGQTRVIRRAYFEHPDYVPLLNRAYEKWTELEQQSGQRLLFCPGLIEVGPAAGVIIPGVRRAAREHALQLEEIDAHEFADRFPGFVLPDNQLAVFEPDGGYLLVEQCVLAYCKLACRHGAQLSIGEAVQGWKPYPGTSSAGRIEIITDRHTYLADRLVITAGAWASQLLHELDVELVVRRKHLHWYHTGSNDYLVENRSPLFFYETQAGCYYGFPNLDGNSVKVAEHTGGETISDPSHVSRDIDPGEQQRVEAFLHRHMPAVSQQAVKHSVCMYTMSPDEHFIVDCHPRHDSVALAAGLSGHGFKFASVLGEVLADLVISGRTKQSADFLRLQRPSLHR